MTLPLGAVNATVNSLLFENPLTTAEACQRTSEVLAYVVSLQEGIVWMLIIVSVGFVITLAASLGLFNKFFDGKKPESDDVNGSDSRTTTPFQTR